jgi:hypothetical protein
MPDFAEALQKSKEIVSFQFIHLLKQKDKVRMYFFYLIGVCQVPKQAVTAIQRVLRNI